MAGENQGVNGVTEIWKYGSGLADMVFFARNRDYVATLLKMCCSWNKQNFQ